MATKQGGSWRVASRRRRLSVDWWAVTTALVLTALVLVGVIHDVPW